MANVFFYLQLYFAAAKEWVFLNWQFFGYTCFNSKPVVPGFHLPIVLIGKIILVIYL
jgi:hypothetical protein